MSRNSKESRDFWNSLSNSCGQAAAIDPRDSRGFKNAYISMTRDLAIFEATNDLPDHGTLLDFGCGTGTFLSHLSTSRPRTILAGIDVSRVMLRHAVERDERLSGKVFLYDGERLPFRDGSLDVITTGGVLLYFRDEEDFLKICREFERVLKPGGKVIAVEQVRYRTRVDVENMKVQRTPEEFNRLFSDAGMKCTSWRQIRRARFPLVYAIRFGLMPRALHGFVARLESRLWRHAPLPRMDYADAVFTFMKQGRTPGKLEVDTQVP